MSRIVSALVLASALAVGATAYAKLSSGGGEPIAIPPSMPGSAVESAAPQTSEQARRTGAPAAFTPLIERLRVAVAESPRDAAAWRRLAEALLQRAQLASHLRGLRVGHPVFAELPAPVAADVDEAEAAIARARELGDDSAEIHRIAAEVMSQRITGITTALQWNGKIKQEIQAAAERAADDPRLHLVLGMRSLMAPRFFGHDAEKALEHFTYAARSLPDDERPALFAGMASHLLKKRLDAIAWLEQAVARNPHNVFARVVLQRVRRGEDDPFGRDIAPAEVEVGPEPDK